jgi:hypothetical protein
VSALVCRRFAEQYQIDALSLEPFCPQCVLSAARGLQVKLLTEYLEHALSFERLAAEENNTEIKAQFETQAAAYRKLAADRAAKIRTSSSEPTAELGS